MNSADFSRRLTWNPNVHWNPATSHPEGERGATTTEAATWQEAIVAIEGGPAST